MRRDIDDVPRLTLSDFKLNLKKSRRPAPFPARPILVECCYIIVAIGEDGDGDGKETGRCSLFIADSRCKSTLVEDVVTSCKPFAVRMITGDGRPSNADTQRRALEVGKFPILLIGRPTLPMIDVI